MNIQANRKLTLLPMNNHALLDHDVARFTAHHWPDLATALFPAIIKADSFCNDYIGACFFSYTDDGEVSCDACKEVTEQVGILLGDEEIIADAVCEIPSIDI